MPSQQLTHVCFTAFTDAAPLADATTFIAYQREVCPATQREHWQGYAEFPTRRTIRTIQEQLGCPGAHIEKRRGTAQQAAEYANKDATRKPGSEPVSIGCISQPTGQCNGAAKLSALQKRILDGTPVEALRDEDPMAFHQYGRTLMAIEDAHLRKKFRTTMTRGTWLWGPTGVGKSHRAFDEFDPATHYLWKLDDRGWQDGYAGQKTVIINDFRGEIPFNHMLQLVDKWPYTVSRRGREPAPFLAEKVIVTSAMHPHEVYRKSLADGDKLAQFDRRFEVIEMIPDGAAPTGPPPPPEDPLWNTTP